MVSSPGVDVDSLLGEITVTILVDDDYTIVECSPGFTALSGPLDAGQHLLKMMTEARRKPFERWIQRAANGFSQTHDGCAIFSRGSSQLRIEHIVESCSFQKMAFDPDGQVLSCTLACTGVRERKMNEKTSTRPERGGRFDRRHLSPDKVRTIAGMRRSILQM